MLNFFVIGDSRVGKTSLIQTFAKNAFPTGTIKTSSTISTRKAIIYNGVEITLNLYDTPGAIKESPFISGLNDQTLGVLLVFSLTDRTSFVSLRKWMDIIKQNTHYGVPIVLLANKMDFEDRAISSQDIQNFVRENQLRFIEGSAKAGVNVESAFLMLTEQVLAQATTMSPRKRQGSTSSRFTLPSRVDKAEEAMQSMMETKIQECMLSFKAELSAQMHELRRRDYQELESRLINIDKTERYFDDLREENRVLMEKVTYLEQSLGNTQRKSARRQLTGRGRRDSDFFQDDSNNGSIGNDDAVFEMYREPSDETSHLKKRIERCETKLTETLSQVDSKLRAISSSITSGINKKFSELTETYDLVPKNEEPKIKPFTVGDSLDQTDEKSSEQKQNKAGKEKPKRGRKPNLMIMTEDELAEREALEREALERTNLQQSSVVAPSLTLEIKQSFLGRSIRGKSHTEITPRETTLTELGIREQDVEYRLDDNMEKVMDEIGNIWRTINTMIENTQDEFSRLRLLSQGSPDMYRTSPDSINEASSVADLPTEGSPNFREDDFGDIRSPAKTKRGNQEKDIRRTIKETKDDVHNQIIGVQREFDREMTNLRNTLFGYFTTFSDKAKVENVELKRYIDEKIDTLISEIQGACNENNNMTNKSMADYKVFRKMMQSDAAHVEVDVLEDSNIDPHVDRQSIQLTIGDLEKKQIQSIQEELNKSVWETLGLLASRLTTVERNTAPAGRVSLNVK